MEKRIIQIAIDGPSGAGKSTLAKYLAKTLCITYLDTGAMYRSFAFYAWRHHVSGTDDASIKKLFETFDLRLEDGKVILNGEDVTLKIRTPEMDIKVSEFAGNPIVRKELVALQRSIGAKQSIVMEGRDIGSVVLPDTPFKFYVDASLEERAKRRYLQNIEKNLSADIEYIKQDIIRRDKIDSSRDASPLCIPEGAYVIDTSDMDIEAVAQKIIDIVNTGE